jgi:hypothetical protein
MADGDDGMMGLQAGPLSRSVPGSGFDRWDRGIGCELDIRPENPGGIVIEDDGAVHLAQFAEPGGRELDVEPKPAIAEVLNALIESEDDQRPRPAAQNAFETIAKWRARGDPGEHSAMRRDIDAFVHPNPPLAYPASV